jgi:hypothetical protein
LADAVKKVNSLSALDPSNVEISHFITKISGSLTWYQQALNNWLNQNIITARRKIDKIEPDLYNTHFYEISENLTFEGFQKLNGLDLEYLVHLTPQIKREIHYTSEDDDRLRSLCTRLDSATKRGKLDRG